MLCVIFRGSLVAGAGFAVDEPPTLPAGKPAAATSLRRIQAHLFADVAAPAALLGDDVTILSAPGESRECVEIARLCQREAARGVRFDRMAILLRAPAP